MSMCPAIISRWPLTRYVIATDTGQQVAAVMRRLSDTLFDSVDSSALLTMLARLAKSNRKHTRVRDFDYNAARDYGGI